MTPILYGNRERFAAEWALDENYGGTWMFGRIRLWVGGTQVGDWSQGTSLRDAWLSLRYPVGDSGKRHSEAFHSMPAKSVVEKIELAYYCDDEAAKDSLGEGYARFMIELPPDEGFNGWRLYMTEGATEARLVLAFRSPEATSTHIIKEQFLHKGEFDALVSKLQAELEQRWQFERNIELTKRDDS